METEIQQLLKRTNALQGELLEQAAADAEGFLPLRRAYGIPKDDPARESVMQRAAEAACAAPLRIMELCADALDAAGRLADIGSRLAVSDAGVRGGHPEGSAGGGVAERAGEHKDHDRPGGGTAAERAVFCPAGAGRGGRADFPRRP